jgi:amidohydrolase
MNNDSITSDIMKKKVENIVGEITEIRHQLHRMPEIMFKEYKTSEFIKNYLKNLDIEIQKPYIKTDVVAVIRGGKPGKTILLRADIDALPVDESSSAQYSSQVSGMAHSCGHDGHISILLGAAKILSEMKNDIKGNIKLIFQPAEEEGGGGKILVAEGILRDEPGVDEVYALHGWSYYGGC